MNIFKEYSKTIEILNHNYRTNFEKECLLILQQIKDNKNKSIYEMPIKDWILNLSRSDLELFMLDIFNLSLSEIFEELCFIYFNMISDF